MTLAERLPALWQDSNAVATRHLGHRDIAGKRFATIRALASAVQRRRRPVPVITSIRRNSSGLGSTVWSFIGSNRSCCGS